MGCIEWGWYFFIHQRVVNAAREGARAGTLLDPPPAATEDEGEQQAEAAAEDYLQQVGLERTGVVATYRAHRSGRQVSMPSGCRSTTRLIP